MVMWRRQAYLWGVIRRSPITTVARQPGQPAAGHFAPPPVAVVHDARECPQCGLVQRMPDSQPGQTIRCVRCRAWLRNHRADPTMLALSCSLTALILYLIVLGMPLMTLDLYGRIHTVTIMTGPVALWNAPGLLAFVGFLVALATVLMPGVVIGLNLMVLFGARRPRAPFGLPRLLRWQGQLRPWSMIEVYMLGVFVAYTKLVDLAYVELDASIFALAGIMVLMIAADGAFDTQAVWDRIGQDQQAERGALASVEAEAAVRSPGRVIACDHCELVMLAPGPGETIDGGSCPRCHATLHRRQPDSLRRTVAFLAASAILYVPANILPVLTLTRFGRGEPSTIIGGVEQLYQGGMLPLALLVFVASICVPCLKVVGLTVMVIMTHFRLAAGLHDRTRLFRVIDFIGRWSMIDVFMISILVALVHFGFFANVDADPGIVAFASVVVLTIFAAESFDPRLMWDMAGSRAGRRAVQPIGPRVAAE